MWSIIPLEVIERIFEASTIPTKMRISSLNKVLYCFFYDFRRKINGKLYFVQKMVETIIDNYDNKSQAHMLYIDLLKRLTIKKQKCDLIYHYGAFDKIGKHLNNVDLSTKWYMNYLAWKKFNMDIPITINVWCKVISIQQTRCTLQLVVSDKMYNSNLTNNSKLLAIDNKCLKNHINNDQNDYNHYHHMKCEIFPHKSEYSENIYIDKYGKPYALYEGNVGMFTLFINPQFKHDQLITLNLKVIHYTSQHSLD